MRDHLVDLYVNIINVIGQGSRNLANEVQRLTEILAQAESQMHQTSDLMQAQQKTIDEFQRAQAKQSSKYSEADGTLINVEYTKNVLFQYLTCHDDSLANNLLQVIFKAFRFSDKEQ